MDNSDAPPSPSRPSPTTHPDVDLASSDEVEIIGHEVRDGEPYYIVYGPRELPQDQVPPHQIRKFWEDQADGNQPLTVAAGDQPSKPKDN